MRTSEIQAKCGTPHQRFQFDLGSMGIRYCSRCNSIKDLSDFTYIESRGYYNNTCKNCKSEWMRTDRIKNPSRYKNHDLKMYGIDLNKYNEILIKQNGSCAICNKQISSQGRMLHVDHNHTTGKVRGLLCGNCNTGIGKLGEDEKVLSAAIEYLRRV
jgi:hypothetical protein